MSHAAALECSEVPIQVSAYRYPFRHVLAVLARHANRRTGGFGYITVYLLGDQSRCGAVYALRCGVRGISPVFLTHLSFYQARL